MCSDYPQRCRNYPIFRSSEHPTSYHKHSKVNLTSLTFLSYLDIFIFGILFEASLLRCKSYLERINSTPS